MLKQKKGVSPLIATVLLIAFAVALGAVVMNWGKSFTTGQMQQVQDRSDRDIKCTMDVSLGVTEIGGAAQMCYGAGPTANTQYLYFAITNIGTRDVYQIDVHILGDGDPGTYSNTTMNGTTIAQGAMLRRNITYDNSTIGSIQKVSIVPKVDLAGKIVTCSGNSLDRDSTEIRAC
jgi:flagellin-like protein